MLCFDNPLDKAEQFSYTCGQWRRRSPVTNDSEEPMGKKTTELLKKAMGMLEDAKNIISSISEEARGEFDELSEKQQENAKGEALDSLASLLEEMDDSIDEVVDNLGDIINEK